MSSLKSTLLLFTTLTFCSLNLLGQVDPETKQERCGSTMQAHQNRMNEDSTYRNRVKSWKKKIAPLVKARKENKNPTCSNGPIIVPIAIHFDAGLVGTTEEACAITIVEDQIAELNLELLGQDVDAGLINNFTSCFGAGILGDACLQFCIATENHPASSGLLSGDPAITFGQLNFNVPSGNFTPVNSDWADYMNVYVDNLGGGLLGVSNGIPGGFNGDGVLVDNCVFGTGNINCSGVQTTGSAGCFGTYDEGETLAHEIGHYFGLFHIWGDNFNCNGSQDNIADTPDMSNNYSGYLSCANHTSCSNLPSTCGDEDMYMNFMSYAGDACMYMFTSDQSDVMNATAITQGFGTTTPKCVPPPLTANFSPIGLIEICQPDCINYIDLSTDNPTSWAWSFNVISGDIVLDILSSTDQNPDVCITSGTNGIIETTLIATNSLGSDDITQSLTATVMPLVSYYPDDDGDGFGAMTTPTLSCQPVGEMVTNATDCDDTNPNINPAATEICDGIDNNCDGQIDETGTNTYYADTDSDGFGDINNSVTGCTVPTGYVTNSTDCDDTDANNYPGNTEVCDGLDNNCNGLVDENVSNVYYADTDGDGFGDSNNSVTGCTTPAGYVTNSTDCDDTDANNYPGNTEVCDGLDNNCNGLVDENGSNVYFADTDGDGFGDSNNSVTGCTTPAGYVTNSTDCDDTDANNYPGNTEACDGQDNNCDGITDEGCIIPDCDSPYLVINTITQNTYRAQINIISDAIVNSGPAILYTAGTDIDLLPGFEVILGTDFEARIEPCTPFAPGNGTSKIQNPLSEFLYELSEEIGGESIEIEFVITNKKGKVLKAFNLSSEASHKDMVHAIGELSKGLHRITVKTPQTVIEKELFIIR